MQFLKTYTEDCTTIIIDMYIPLSQKEKNLFLSQIEITISIPEEIAILKETPFSMRLKHTHSNLNKSILEGHFSKYSNFMVVRQLEASRYNALIHYRSLYEVFCCESLKKIIAFAKLYEKQNLRIYTSDEILVEQLYDLGALLDKVAPKATKEVVAYINLGK